MSKLCTVFLAFALVIPLGVMADTYSYELISVPGAEYTRAYGINNRGQVVGHCYGYFHDWGLPDRGFLYEDGEFQFLYGMTWATSINNRGQIVGGGWYGEGVLYENGEYQSFYYPDAWGTQPFGINDHGQIVGNSYEFIYGFPYEIHHGFLYENGQFQIIDYPAYITDINDRGQIVVNGLIYENGEFKSNKCQTFAFGINNSGDTVGPGFSFLLPVPADPGFLCKKGKFQLLNYPGTTGGTAIANDINDRGQIVGNYGNQGFIATKNRRAPSVSGSQAEVTTTWAFIKSK